MFENGCEWVRCDFHLHTMKDKEFKYEGEDNSFIKDYIYKLENEKIKVAVITNHNKFDLGEYKALKNKANKKEILILPGVELSVKDGKNGLHTLIVFNPDEWFENGENHIDNFLTAAFQGINNRENENACCNWDLDTLLVELEKLNKDYFIVFAHIEQKNGLIEECGGGRLQSLAEKHEFKKRVLGLQKLRTNDNKIKIKNWFGYEIAYVEGSDPKEIDEIGKGKECYVKIGEYSFNSLKFSLQNYEDRVSNEKMKINHGYIESISFQGGKLDKIQIPFSNELNTLIGIRGSGKSSILEVIRYALGLKVNVDESYKENLVKNTLGSGGEITLNIIDKYGNQYKLKKIMGEQSFILDQHENDVGISIDSLINSPLYFGQKDLSDTESGYELNLLKKLVGSKISEKQNSMENIILNLDNSIRELFQLELIPEKIEELNTKKNDLEHTIKILNEKGLEKKLNKQISYNSDHDKIVNLIKKVNEFVVNIENSYNGIDKESFELLDYSKFNEETFKNINITLKNILDSIGRISSEIEDINKNKDFLELEKKRFEEKLESLKEEFAMIKREINDETLDSDSYVKYKKELDEVKENIKSLSKKNSFRELFISKIQKSIRERNTILKEIFEKYEKEIKKINESQNELQIKIEFKGNKDKFIQDLKDNLQGTGIKGEKCRLLSNKFSDFVSIISDCILNDSKEIRSILTDNEAAKLYDKIKNNYSELIKKACPDLVEIYYHNKLLEQHSMGQRASALILFILTQQESDLIIIDQPEDDLDNQIIYQEVINTIKKKKKNIQFIFATHNANIPVLGDAECVIAAEYDNEKINTNIGNIDCKYIQQKIVDIMEGGNEAFEKRKLIYSNWNNVSKK